MITVANFISLFQRLRNAEHFDVNNAISIYLKEKVTAVAMFEKGIRTYLAYFEQEDIIFKRWRILQETSTLKEMDRVRDDLTIALQQTVGASLRLLDPAVKDAAAQLDFILKRFNNPHRRPYKENTALIKNMLQELEKDEVRPAVELLGLEGTLADLKNANEDFRILFYERADKKEEDRKEAPLAAVRRKVDESLQEVIDSINSLAHVNGIGANDATLAGTLGEMADKINAVIRQAEEDYYRRVEPSRPATEPAEPEVPGKPDENWETYMMTVSRDYWNTLPEQPYLFFFFYDADPDAFDKRFRGVDLSGANFYWGIDTDNDETFFSHFLEEDGKLVGFAAYNNRLNVDGKVEGKDSVLRRNGVDLIRLDKAHAPIFVD